MKYNPTDNPIVIKCKAHQTEPIDRLIEFQGNLKRLSEKNREKLIGSICTKGFIAPIFVWDDHGEWKLLDGHQRLKTLIWMRQHGWDIPMLPVDVIEADDEQDAKKKLLAITSQYGEFDIDGYMEFTDGIEIDESIRLVDGEYFAPQEGDIDLDFTTNDGETINDTLDHFDITLTFNKEDEEKVKELEKAIGKKGIVDLIRQEAGL
jgi:hypothetical protein